MKNLNRVHRKGGKKSDAEQSAITAPEKPVAAYPERAEEAKRLDDLESSRRCARALCLLILERLLNQDDAEPLSGEVECGLTELFHQVFDRLDRADLRLRDCLKRGAL